MDTPLYPNVVQVGDGVGEDMVQNSHLDDLPAALG